MLWYDFFSLKALIFYSRGRRAPSPVQSVPLTLTFPRSSLWLLAESAWPGDSLNLLANVLKSSVDDWAQGPNNLCYYSVITVITVATHPQTLVTLHSMSLPLEQYRTVGRETYRLGQPSQCSFKGNHACLETATAWETSRAAHSVPAVRLAIKSWLASKHPFRD